MVVSLPGKNLYSSALCLHEMASSLTRVALKEWREEMDALFFFKSKLEAKYNKGNKEREKNMIAVSETYVC